MFTNRFHHVTICYSLMRSYPSGLPTPTAWVTLHIGLSTIAKRRIGRIGVMLNKCFLGRLEAVPRNLSGRERRRKRLRGGNNVLSHVTSHGDALRMPEAG